MNNVRDVAIGLGALIVIIGGILLFSGSGKNGDTGSGAVALAASEERFDFGTISMAKGKVSHAFTIRNKTAEDVEITKLYTSCMCTKASLVRGERRLGPYGMQGHGFIPHIKEVLAPGEEASVEVIFDPAAHGPAGVGEVERQVYVETRSFSPLLLTIAATITP